MSWNTVQVMVSWTTMDPGVRNCDSNTEYYARQDIKVGQYLNCDDPSNTLPSIKVLEVKEESLIIKVGEREKSEVIEPGRMYLLCKTGYNYAYFELEIRLLTRNN